MDAGRGELYVRDIRTGVESILPINGLDGKAFGEPTLLPKIPNLHVVEMTAANALPGILRVLATGGSDIALTDASYVREAADIYAHKPIATA
jgi:hypothetical protein